MPEDKQHAAIYFIDSAGHTSQMGRDDDHAYANPP